MLRPSTSLAMTAKIKLLEAELSEPRLSDLPGGLMSAIDSSASSNLILAVIAKEVLGININIVRGYTGAATLFLAMARGEIDGQFVGLSSIKSGQRDLWNRRAFRMLMAFGRTTRHPDFPDVPIGRELAKDANALALID